VERLFPDPGPTTTADQLGGYEPWDGAPTDRPFVALNFATTLDGRATLDGRSGAIGSAADTAMLVELRTRFDAVMIGAGTMRAERYGRIAAGPDQQRRREARGLPADPLVVIVSGHLDLPWDAPLFADAESRVLIATSSDREPPAVAAKLELLRQEGGVDLAAALRELRADHDVAALLCEGGPTLHSQLQAGGLADELFLTIAPKLSGAPGPSILEGALPAVAELDLEWLLAEGSELFGRYRRRWDDRLA
jgi:riboflavin-specific deaminase-like protein